MPFDKEQLISYFMNGRASPIFDRVKRTTKSRFGMSFISERDFGIVEGRNSWVGSTEPKRIWQFVSIFFICHLLYFKKEECCRVKGDSSDLILKMVSCPCCHLLGYTYCTEWLDWREHLDEGRVGTRLYRWSICFFQYLEQRKGLPGCISTSSYYT